MNVFDLHSYIFGVPAIPVVTVDDTTPQVSAIIDTAEFYALEFVTVLGALHAASSFAVTIEDGDDSALTDAAAVPADFLIGTLANAGFVAADANGIKRIGYVGHKRYVRYTVTPTVNGGDSSFGVIALNAFPRNGATEENV